MRLALLTDIHANREAFSAVLQDIAERRIDRIVILGDIVGYGPDPSWCVDKARALVADGAICVQGNHDAAISTPDPALNVTAKRAILWTRPHLDDDQRAFLAGLPLTNRHDDTLFVHASANDPAAWIYVTGENRATPSFRVTDARLIFCGHVHVPALMSCDVAGRVQQQRIPMGNAFPLIRSRRWLGVIGAVGQARDGTPGAHYAILDLGQNELTFRRIAYDTARTAQKIREAGLPESLAMRIVRGV